MSNSFWIIWGVCAALSLIFVVYRVIARKRRGPLFPAPGEFKILFEENWASGRSLENVFTQLGARNCLKLTVTPDELWTTMWFPFSFFADFYDLEHRIKKQDIISVGEANGLFKSGTLIVEYRREDGRQARLELTPKRYEAFKKALEAGMNVT